MCQKADRIFRAPGEMLSYYSRRIVPALLKGGTNPRHFRTKSVRNAGCREGPI